ncbi:MAG: ribonuclease P protein component, partial [Wenzhouxiangellaceae bacterium]
RLFRLHHAAPPRGQPPVPRLGLAIARRAVRRASDRNRLRRQARETFRLRRARLRPGDYIVTALPAAANADRAELRSALEHLWHRFELK